MKILVVEDDHFFQKFYSLKLKEAGFEVDLAGDGVEALEKLTQYKPDLILLDIIMPKKDVFEVLEALKGDPALKNIPVLVFSTLGQDSDVERAKNLGARDFVNKSFFDFDNLVVKVKSLLSK